MLTQICPRLVSPPGTPFTLQVTAVLAVLVTVAVNCCVRLTTTVAVSGATLTATGGATVTVAVADLVLSATLDAEPVAQFLGGCPALHVEGRTFPLDIQIGRAHV